MVNRALCTMSQLNLLKGLDESSVQVHILYPLVISWHMQSYRWYQYSWVSVQSHCTMNAKSVWSNNNVLNHSVIRTYASW